MRLSAPVLGLMMIAMSWSMAAALEPPPPPGLPALPPAPEPPALPPLPEPPALMLPVVPGLNADFLDSRDSTSFADAAHDHDERYYTEAESDARFAAIGHHHDQRYLGIGAKAADSDRLDGLDSSQFLRSDTDGTLRGRLTMVGGGPVLRLDNSDDGGSWWIRHNSGSAQFVVGATGDLSDGNIKLRLERNGDFSVTGHIFAHGGSHIGDVAEPVVGEGLTPGTVVVGDGFDAVGKLRVRPADAPASKGVVGIVSTDPSLILAGLATDTPLAVSGIVPVKVAGPVARDSLLTSSAVLGHAQACPDAASCFGAVIGKALEAHAGPGPAVIRAMVALG